MDERRITRLFARLKGMYGHRWTSQHDADGAMRLAMATWQAALAGATDKQIKAGLDWCAQNGGEWPPSLPTFRALCVGMQGEAAERGRQSAGIGTGLQPSPSRTSRRPRCDGSSRYRAQQGQGARQGTLRQRC